MLIWISFSRTPVNIFYVIPLISLCYCKMNNVLQRCCSNDSLSHNIKLSQYEIYSNGLKFEKLAGNQFIIYVLFYCGIRWVIYCLQQETRSYFILFWRRCISDRWSKHVLLLASSMQLKNFPSEKSFPSCCWMLFHIQMG